MGGWGEVVGTDSESSSSVLLHVHRDRRGY